ncbi:MAG: LysR family transcriptional regulator [Sphaerobacter sp.]|nr:LysR family transcriptional regulator [Sphaerobacter sp.]
MEPHAPVRIRVKCWAEQSGALVLSDWRIELLTAVEERGSLSAAADDFGVAYRVAWGKIREMEQRLGVKLLQGHSGGTGGGGSALTPAGQELVTRYRRFRAGLDALVEQRFAETLGDLAFLRERYDMGCRTPAREEQE